MLKTSLIIPAYNEEKRLGAVLEAAKGCSLINEIVVVDDGSTDLTSQVAQQHGVKLIKLARNEGKGRAVQVGLEETTESEFIVLSDADIIGLKAEHFTKLIKPLLEDESLDMTVGKFVGGRLRTDLSQWLVPAISGQRALRRRLVATLPDLSKARFGVEVVITRLAKSKNAKVKEVILNDLTHIMKEEKLGLAKGLLARLKMYQEIFVSLKRKQ